MQDIGYGHIENCKGKAAAFEKAKKEAATDAMKRALRTFGNVLGNCLYDKDYLQRIAKVKSGPTKWNPDNLHRHHDFAPMLPKKEPGMEEARYMQPAWKNGPTNTSKAIEAEDEYGADPFDEMEVAESQTDEITFHDHKTPSRPGSVPPAELSHLRHQPDRYQQGPNMRAAGAEATTRQHLTTNLPTASTPVGDREASTTARAQSAIASHNPNAPSDHSHTIPPHRATPPMAMAIDAQTRKDSDHAYPSNAPPVGFVSGSTAKKLADGAVTVINSDTPRFNPHAESPSIRKTAGIDHGKSTKVQRDALPVPEDSQSNTSGIVQQAMPRPSANQNLANPPGDLTRKIGIPASNVPSPLGSRTAYKRPGPAGINGHKRLQMSAPEFEAETRSPLADVSNTVPSAAGMGDGEANKRIRTS